MNLYRERACLVSALSRLYPAYLAEDVFDEDWTVVLIELPTGQVSWHIAAEDLDLFHHLKDGPNTWDAHSTEEKYARLLSLRQS